jgi:hypothetical protein
MKTLYGCGNILPNSLECEMLLIQEIETLKTHILLPVAYTCCKSYLDLANTHNFSSYAGFRNIFGLISHCE